MHLSEYWDSSFFALGRPWAVFLGTGIGLGMGYSNCQNDFRSPYVPSPSMPLTRADRHVPLVSNGSGHSLCLWSFFRKHHRLINLPHGFHREVCVLSFASDSSASCLFSPVRVGHCSYSIQRNKQAQSSFYSSTSMISRTARERERVWSPVEVIVNEALSFLTRDLFIIISIWNLTKTDLSLSCRQYDR